MTSWQSSVASRVIAGKEVCVEFGTELAEFIEGKIAELAALVETVADGVADFLVGFAEGHALVDEVRGRGHGVEETGFAGGTHAVGAESERARERGEDEEHFVRLGGRGEDGLLGLLHIFVVGERQAFEE